jgi:L-iditol 2-dehydrogenase
LLRVTLAGLCRTDLFVAQGKIPTPPDIILGHEFAATVQAVGEDVNSLAVGDNVGVMPVFETPEGFEMLGVQRNGAFSEFITLPAEHIYKLSDSLSTEEVAFLEPIAACMSVVKTPIHKQEKGLIYGENRIAELTMRIMKAVGFEDVTVADFNTINSESNAQYDFVIETSPTEADLAEVCRLVKQGGTIILKSRPFESVAMPITQIVQKEIKIFGKHYAPFEDAIDLLDSGKLDIKDLLGEIYSFEEAVEILSGRMTLSEEKKVFFKP